MATKFFKVDLDGRSYTYKAEFDVSVGDRVVVPPNRVSPEPQVAPVIRLLNKPDYDVDKIVAALAKVGDPLSELEAMLAEGWSQNEKNDDPDQERMEWGND